MSHLKMMRLADVIINLTDSLINMYVEGDGAIWSFAPHRLDFRLPSNPEDNSAAVYYAVDADTLAWIKRSGRALDDIALVVGKNVGRNNTEIASLVWAADLKMTVRPCIVTLRHCRAS